MKVSKLLIVRFGCYGSRTKSCPKEYLDSLPNPYISKNMIKVRK